MNSVDTSRTIKVMQSPTKINLVVLGSVFVFSASLPGVLGWYHLRPVGYVATLAAAILSACSVPILIWRLMTNKSPLLVISPVGLSWVRPTPTFRALQPVLIPWTEVRGLGSWSYVGKGSRFLTVQVDPAFEATLWRTKLARWLAAGDKRVGVKGIAIGVQATEMDYETLVSTVQAYWMAHGSGQGAQNVEQRAEN